MSFRLFVLRCIVISLVWTMRLSTLHAELPIKMDQPFAAKDSLDIGDEANQDAQRCLDGLSWKPCEFDVRCDPTGQARYEFTVRFPSPVSTDDAINDTVAMEWHLARDEKGKVITAPAVIVVHESGSKMAVGRAIAFGLSRLGIHAFMIQLPGYGLRRNEEKQKSSDALLKLTRQAIVDTRRARDAVAVLPMVDQNNIAVQGTSLGGFVTATAASLDRGFDSVFILLAGADLYGVIQHGDRDVEKLRGRLREAGVTDTQLKEMLEPIEPKRVAHRMDPKRTWLFSAKHDTVVPPRHAKLLAEVARLSSDHHIELNADHYSGAIFLPQVLMQIRATLKTEAVGAK